MGDYLGSNCSLLPRALAEFRDWQGGQHPYCNRATDLHL